MDLTEDRPYGHAVVKDAGVWWNHVHGLLPARGGDVR